MVKLLLRHSVEDDQQSYRHCWYSRGSCEILTESSSLAVPLVSSSN